MRVGPARLCLRRRCRACLDIAGCKPRVPCRRGTRAHCDGTRITAALYAPCQRHEFRHRRWARNARPRAWHTARGAGPGRASARPGRPVRCPANAGKPDPVRRSRTGRFRACASPRVCACANTRTHRCAPTHPCVETVRATESGPGADGGRARYMARAVDLASARVGRGRGHRGDARVRPCPARVRPTRGDARVRLARRPAGGARRALGLGVVSGDRPLRLPPRTGLLYVRSRRVLSAVSARSARAVGPRAAGGAGRRAAVAGGVCVCAVWHPSPEPRSSWPGSGRAGGAT